MNELEEFEFRHRLEQEQAQPQSSMPTMAQVAMNAVPKGVANLLNTPHLIGDVMEKGLAKLPYAETLMPGITKRADEMGNVPMDLATKAGLVNPAYDPQTGPQRIVDTAIQAGIGSALPIGGVVKSAITGTISGAAAQTTKEVTGSDTAALAVGMATPLISPAVAMRAPANAAILKNPTKLATAQEGMAAGLKVPPSYIKPSFTSNSIQSVGGKAATKQAVQTANVETIDNIARQAVGIQKGVSLEAGLEKVHELANGPYRAVDALRSSVNMDWFPRFHSTSLLEDLKAARANATRAFKEYNANRNMDTLAKAKGFRAEATSIENDIEKVAIAANRPDLVQQLKDARTLHAKAYDIERALNTSDGHIDASVFAKMIEKKKPLSGELQVIGRFASAFPDAVRKASRIQSSGVSALDATLAAGLGTAGYYGSGGDPQGLSLAMLPLLRGPARSLMLSKGYQSKLLKESMPVNPSTGAIRSALVGTSLLDYTPEEVRR